MIQLRYNLQYFAKDGPGGEKTEDATSKKLDDARKEGQVAKSIEIVTAFTLIGLFLVLKAFVGFMGNSFLEAFKSSFEIIENVTRDEFTVNTGQSLLNFGIKYIIMIGAPVLIVAFIIAFVGNVAQVKWQISLKTMEPKWNKISPISGFKRLFSKDKLVELVKSIGKVGVISYVVYDALKDKWPLLFNLYSVSLFEAIQLIGETVIDLGLKISIFFLAIGIFDLWYQRRKFKEDMKMTKQEIKDEYKQTEGDPHIKGKIRQKMQEVSRKRMMQQMPEADVVITNPTHLAVAVKYDRGSQSAPYVIAKGADNLAKRIKDIAKEHDIEIVENKPLARMLYYNVELGQEIPQELYQMVAEVLAYVYGLKGNL